MGSILCSLIISPVRLFVTMTVRESIIKKTSVPAWARPMPSLCCFPARLTETLPVASTRSLRVRLGPKLVSFAGFALGRAWYAARGVLPPSALCGRWLL